MATFSGCSITGPAGSYTLSATDGTEPASGRHQQRRHHRPRLGHPSWRFTAQPPSSQPTAPRGPTHPSRSAIQDIGGNTIATNSDRHDHPGLSPSGATLNCTGGATQQATHGVATFTGCSITGPAGNYTLSATDGTESLTGATSNACHHHRRPGHPGWPSRPSRPSSRTDGATWPNPPVQVSIQDIGGNTCHQLHRHDHPGLCRPRVRRSTAPAGPPSRPTPGWPPSRLLHHRPGRHLHPDRHRRHREPDRRHQQRLSPSTSDRPPLGLHQPTRAAPADGAAWPNQPSRSASRTSAATPSPTPPTRSPWVCRIRPRARTLSCTGGPTQPATQRGGHLLRLLHHRPSRLLHPHRHRRHREAYPPPNPILSS